MSSKGNVTEKNVSFLQADDGSLLARFFEMMRVIKADFSLPSDTYRCERYRIGNTEVHARCAARPYSMYSRHAVYNDVTLLRKTWYSLLSVKHHQTDRVDIIVREYVEIEVRAVQGMALSDSSETHYWTLERWAAKQGISSDRMHHVEKWHSNTLASLIDSSSMSICEVRGEAIRAAYRRGAGRSSCMTGDDRQHLTAMYAQNTEKVSLVIVSQGSTELARALVWQCDDGRVLLDTVYAISNLQETAVRKCLTEYIDKKYGEQVFKGNLRETNLVCTVRLTRSRNIPFMDSFTYGSLHGDRATGFSVKLRTMGDIMVDEPAETIVRYVNEGGAGSGGCFAVTARPSIDDLDAISEVESGSYRLTENDRARLVRNYERTQDRSRHVLQQTARRRDRSSYSESPTERTRRRDRISGDWVAIEEIPDAIAKRAIWPSIDARNVHRQEIVNALRTVVSMRHEMLDDLCIAMNITDDMIRRMCSLADGVAAGIRHNMLDDRRREFLEATRSDRWVPGERIEGFSQFVQYRDDCTPEDREASRRLVI